MNTRLLILIGGAAIGLSGTDAMATDYFVRVTGSDANLGLNPALAFRTIKKAAEVAEAGDTVYVGAGTYGDKVEPDNSGTSAERIVFVADTTGAQTGDAGVVIIRVGGGEAIKVKDEDYITFRGFTVEGGKHTIKWERGVGGRLEQCIVRDGEDDLVELKDQGELTITECELTGSDKRGIKVDESTLVMSSSTLSGIKDDAIKIDGDNNVVEIRRCTIFDSKDGIDAKKGVLTVVNCVFYDLSDTGVKIDKSAVAHVYNSTFDEINKDGIRSKATMNAYNNVFTAIGDDGMDRDGGTFNASHNLVWDYGGSRSENFNSYELSFDPQYVNASIRDYSLQSTSQAIDQGQDHADITTVDRLGVGRPTGAAWDLGAYEYSNPAVYASVPYITDFESGAGAEWSERTTSTDSDFTQFLGRYGNQDSTGLYVDGMTGGETYYLFLDVFVIDNVEGSGSYQDDFTITIDGSTALATSFDNNVTGSQLYPGSPSESGSNLGYSSSVDSIYRRVFITFVPDGDRSIIAFDVDMTGSLSSESFGLDNVMVLSEEDAQPYLPVFIDVSMATGFDVENDSGTDTGSGLLWGDIDRDGDLDAVVTGLDARLLLFELSTGAYTPQTLGSGGNVRRQGAMLDADRDGDLDFWAVNVSSYNDERLFAMSGGIMSDVGSAGFSGPSNNEGVAAGDINADGWTDLVMFSENGNWIGINTGESPVTFDATVDSDDGITGFGLSGNGEFASGADVNDDGYPDFLYHYGTGQLFQSRGDGTYLSEPRGIAIRTGGSLKSGSAWGDYDNDGDMDVFSPSFLGGEAGFLHQNLGVSEVYDGVSGEDIPLALFINSASSAGIDSTAQQRGAAWGDFDNDGDLDLLITTDASDPLLLYENQGDETFLLVDKGAAISGDLHDAVFVDYDNDGDLDIAVTRSGDTNVLLENQTDDSSYLKVRMVREGENNALVDVVGARVELWNSDASSILARREIGVARGFGGIEPMWAHFGGVDPAQTYTVRIVWPGGDEVSQQVVPGSVSTTIGSTTIAQMLSVTQADQTRARVIRWREVSSVDDE